MLEKVQHVCVPENRLYQSSLLVPFGANFAFVLHECQQNHNDPKSMAQEYGNHTSAVEHKLLILHNEQPVKVKGCDGALCDFEQFRKQYQTNKQTCDLAKICEL